jgi:demethylmenaquinone methyltransferase/2-methoxy-6-polyprenyl-1,4-benzoquinol methylase
VGEARKVENARKVGKARKVGTGLPTGAAKVMAVREMFDAIAGRYEALNTLLSLGMDRGWRRRCLDALELPPGSRVLDVACGTGNLTREIDQRGLRAVGIDLSLGMLRNARANAPFLLADALSAPLRNASFDGAVSGFALRNMSDLGLLMVELARVIRPGGRVSLLDLGQPEQPVLRLGHRLWCDYAVPRLGALLSDRRAYSYLPRSLAYLPSAPHMSQLMAAAGFVAVEHVLLSGGVSQLYVATRRP